MELAERAFKVEDKVVKDGNRVDKMVVDFSKSKKLKNNKSRNLTCIPIFRATKEPIFPTSNAKKAFNCL